MPANDKDHLDELERFKPRGLGEGYGHRSPTWRPTRIEAEDKASKTIAVVEEVRGSGWRYVVTRAAAVLACGEHLGKAQAIADATRAMERRSTPS